MEGFEVFFIDLEFEKAKTEVARMRTDSVSLARCSEDVALVVALFFRLGGESARKKKGAEKPAPLSHQLWLSIDAARDDGLFFGWPPLLLLPRSRRAGRTGAVAGLRGSVFD